MTLAALPLLFLLAEPGASLRGRVVLAETGEPVTGVTIELSARLPDAWYQQSARSSPEGDFRFERLPAGAYSLSARKTGYLPVAGFPLAVALETNQSPVDLTLRFHRYAVLFGAVAGPDGEPLTGAQVIAYRYRWVDGRRFLARAEQAYTDDRGQYRLFGLPAGTYLVAAFPPRRESPQGEMEYAARNYHPSGAIRLRWGQELSDVNFVLRPETTYSISGVLTDAQAGGPCRSCVIWLDRMEEGVAASRLLRYGTRPDGGYRIGGLTPGTYRVLAEKGSETGGHLAAARTVTIGSRSVSDVHLVVGPDRVIRGRLVLESPPEGLDLERARSFLRLLDPFRSGLRVRVDSDLTFEWHGLAPIPYPVRLSDPPPGGYFKLLRVGGQDLPAPELEIPEEGALGPVEVVIAFDGATLSGAVQPPESAGRGHRVTSATVALYPLENQSPYQFERRVATDRSGNFTLTGIAPGSYTAFALPAGGAWDWDDPEVRRQFARYSRPVDLGRGKTVTLELVLAPESDAAQ